MKIMLSRWLAAGALGLTLATCNSTTTEQKTVEATAANSVLTLGSWRGILAAQGQEIPFLFEVVGTKDKPVVYMHNGFDSGSQNAPFESIKLDEISLDGDSATIRLGVFDAALVVRSDGKGKLKGTWVKYDAKEPYRVPFIATLGNQSLFTPADDDTTRTSFSGTWRTTFHEKEGTTYPAVGVFDQVGNMSWGTFLTSTGDYRYLGGQIISEQEMRLSTFDGSHAFLFIAKKQPDGTLKGDFYSGKSGHETWTATLDPTAKLPDANALTGMKPGQTRLDFKFPNIYAGGSISPTDPKYRGKVVVVQVLGSWCPNCMDESNFLAPWYEQNKARGVEIIGLGYERSTDQRVAAAKLIKMRERMKISYDVALAGQASAAEASKSLPQLAKVLAFPTTIFLDKKGNVRKIHTGFSGPGTGKYYQEEIADFERTVNQLLKE